MMIYCIWDIYINRVPCNTLEDFEDLDESMMCDKIRDPRNLQKVIAGGKNAERRQFPHMVSIMFTDSVLPACLLKDPSKEAPVAIATGWGTMGHRKPLAEILQMGDSGGPLQMDARPGMQCMAIVFGVTSYGKACGYKGSSGMYTKVSHYIPWIESIVGRLPY
ncbi:unnamed protein product [Spodoptera littoralis]|uniref:Peptidase S1 domain-containing protein n=1 Tax=Spodoptera littoralis TaxID=7109 RepID=A0A9P0I6Q9_SPOLI|nr:unnamed protein product [Spodoptera littoralis]CAH1642501.1 unnamed protein product [Spodoptera littoralis]